MDLNQMIIFAKVAEFKSFTRAGKELGIEKSNVSSKITKLENRLGSRLLNRTTRSVTLTEAGAGYYQFCTDILSKAEEADNYVESLNSEPRGTLRVSVPVDAGPMIVNTLVKPFLEKYQKTTIDLCITNRKVDLVKERFNVAIRAGSGPQEDSSCISRQIMRSTNALFASPEFIRLHGEPKSVAELEQSEMIVFASEEEFESKVHIKATIGKNAIHITPKYRLKVNDMKTYLESTLSGLGIAILPSGFVKEYLDKNKLLPVLPEVLFPEVAFYVLYPSRHLKSAKLTMFLEFLKDWQPIL
ncbi:MAG: LysR family transcriptional regulator [Proteobacteria bacterium]|nr:LysR family transcriptional regulator [Pseudomonadota bacterium]